MIEYILTFIWQMFKIVFFILTLCVTASAIWDGDPVVTDTSMGMWVCSFLLFADDLGA